MVQRERLGSGDQQRPRSDLVHVGVGVELAHPVNAARHPHRHRSRGGKILRPPAAGELTLDRDALACVGAPAPQLAVRTAEPGTSFTI
ncbi:hypothetical protein [Streptomyces pinistramenti]|uniref:hypothetical protein n=1 Tax=Streptomyces pinistramenti TaxID=2884812 RepID=UPI001D07F696|nr:hypothetical protein [Streptomyces pinistramenti]MCB5906212.1 hypothetical protein [Streptomyces pinistramenti]